jgi:hypothetical protein
MSIPGEDSNEIDISFIEGREKIINIFGYWPTFHDAEIVELHLWRGDVDPELNKYIFPILTVKIHLFEMSEKTNSDGIFDFSKHTLATLRFHDVVDDFKLSGFNHQNAIMALTFTVQKRGELKPYLQVEFEPAFGMGAFFKCFRIEVLDAQPCDENGMLIMIPTKRE